MLKKAHHLILLLPLVFCVGSGVVSSQTLDPATKFRLAQALEQSGDYDKASTLYRELLSADPLNFGYFDAVQRTYLQMKRYDDAIAVILQRLNSSPHDINLQGLLGSVYYKAGREKEAMAEWENAASFEPANPNSYRVIANILIENRLLDRAADFYRRGRIASGDPHLFTVELAQLLAVSMDYAGATTEYMGFLVKNPTQLTFVQNRMASYTGKEEGRTAAIAVIRTSLNTAEDFRLEELLAWLVLEGKDFPGALQIYRRLDLLSSSHGEGLYRFAERAYKEGAFTVAADAYKDAIDAPLPVQRLPYAKFGYANSIKEIAAFADTLQGPLTASGSPATEASPRYAGAIGYFRKIVEEYPRSEFSARSYYQIGTIQYEKYFDLDGALKSFEQVGREVQGINLIQYDVSLRMGEIQTARGDTARALLLFERVAAATDATPDQTDEANFRLAEIEYFIGRASQAIQRLGSITLNPKADYANDALLLQSFLEENNAASPALVEFGRADFLARQRKNSEAIASFRQLLERYPAVQLADDALARIASLQAKAGLYAEALASYDRLLTDFKDTSPVLDRAQFNIAEIYQFGLHDSPKSIAAYERLLADYPRSVLTTLARKRIRQLRGDVL